MKDNADETWTAKTVATVKMRRHNQYQSRSAGRQQTVISISPKNPMRLACLVITFFFLYFSFFRKNDHRDTMHILPSLHKQPTNEHRLAIVIPFIGQGQDAIPSYLELFCATAAGSIGIADFLIFHDGVFGADAANRFSCPENVIFHSLESLEEFSRTLIRVMDRKPDEQLETGGSRDKLAGIVATLIKVHPYVMVEFKPAFGHIFQEYLTGYSHWGYADLDMMIGDLERWISPDEFDDFDIVTYGFGDQNRLYLRGQFTFHRNDPIKVNQLWRGCDYLSHMDSRFAKVIEKKKKLSFESAEGCYSAAVLQHNDIRIKYAVKAFTDVEQQHEKGARNTAHTHGVYVGTGKKKNKTVIYKASMEHRKSLLTVSNDWFEKRGSIYANSKELLYKPVGERKRLKLKQKEDAKCMYWVQEKYQSRLCIDDVDSTDTVYWINGKLYKEKYELAKLPGNILTAPFFHFQEWKRYYRTAQLGGFWRNGPFTGFVLVKDGILPLYAKGYDSYRKRYKVEKDLIPSPLGHPLSLWHDGEFLDRERLPNRLYCLQSVPEERPPTTKCKFVTSWSDSKTVEILSGAPDWSAVNIDSEVTIAITLQLHSEQYEDTSVIEGFFRTLALYLNHWQGRPAVIVVHVAGATSLVIDMIREKLEPSSGLSDFGMGSVLIGAIFSEKPDTVSRKALMNMAIDASPTRFVLSGYELERGIVPSLDTVYLAHRTAQIYRDSPGSVHIIPQFGIMNGEYDYTVEGLDNAKKDGNLDSVSKVDEGECDGDDGASENEKKGSFAMVEKLWWQLAGIEPNQKDLYGMSVELHALALERLQSEITSLLTEKEHYDLYSTNESPILLFDNRGPRAGMITSDMVREVDEFGGKMCYNSMRFAQMAALGYHINILAGAFAVSTPAVRKSIGDPSTGPLGVSRCDGCFFFTKKRAHEDILEDISSEERHRPAKISLLEQ